MEFQLGTEKSLDGIANYLIRFGLCLKIHMVECKNFNMRGLDVVT